MDPAALTNRKSEDTDGVNNQTFIGGAKPRRTHAEQAVMQWFEWSERCGIQSVKNDAGDPIEVKKSVYLSREQIVLRGRRSGG